MGSYVHTAKISLLATVVALFSPWAMAAMSGPEIDSGVRATLERFSAENPANHELLGKAAGVLVFPSVTKAGLGVGGEYGQGALLVGGHVVGHYKVSGGSVGATAGVAHRSEIIVFMTEEALDKFQASHGWTIGADAGVAVGHHGAGGQYDSQTLRRPIISFVLGEHGLMADLSLEGAKITKLDV
jgi:lipid-binding SYLF domain-containing protein